MFLVNQELYLSHFPRFNAITTIDFSLKICWWRKEINILPQAKNQGNSWKGLLDMADNWSESCCVFTHNPKIQTLSCRPSCASRPMSYLSVKRIFWKCELRPTAIKVQVSKFLWAAHLSRQQRQGRKGGLSDTFWLVCCICSKAGERLGHVPWILPFFCLWL